MEKTEETAGVGAGAPFNGTGSTMPRNQTRAKDAKGSSGKKGGGLQRRKTSLKGKTNKRRRLAIVLCSKEKKKGAAPRRDIMQRKSLQSWLRFKGGSGRAIRIQRKGAPADARLQSKVSVTSGRVRGGTKRFPER